MLYPPHREKKYGTFAGKPDALVPWVQNHGSQMVKLTDNYNKEGSSGSGGSGVGGDIQFLIKSVKKYKQPGKNPAAHIAGENDLRRKVWANIPHV
eukprot:gene3761-6649_t